ncbi:uncharacterized protein KGF55_001047 [Candida pseudojiufengensis]|uniref:uncharacterized protein n=1 Tax=Candida pseudojiufengensis TaxID=497109 RepID=UPI002224E868|nr:uncharacterized protein KGF55_001047 [Candida pseudojiufengensis]KAI5965685.1 hypothetical protein KGF55_001047 [Candida pseudojiufengensis]
MQVFLQLPKEILYLIVSHIEDESIINSLILIPGLRHIALKQKYPTFKINKNNHSIETLTGLFQKYEFTPSVIIGNIDQINQLIDEPAFRVARYELEIAKGTRFSDFVPISEKASVIGLHLDQYLKPLVNFLENNEVQSFLDYVGSNDLLSLTISHLNMFKFQIPNSLKRLTIKGGGNFELNFSDLQNLETFNCEDLQQMNSLENFQLPTSIKDLGLAFCDFKRLGNLSKYNKLKILHISGCPEIYDIFQTELPISLSILTFVTSFQPHRIDELTEEELLDFSILFDEDSRICLNCFPSKLKNLKIWDTMSYLAIGDIELSRTLDCLELNGIGNIESFMFLTSLQNKMSEVIISNCQIVSSNNYVSFPESKSIKFTKNKINSNFFQSNLKGMKSLKVLDFSDNFWTGYDDRYYEEGLDPLDILSDTGRLCFETPELQSLILTCPDYNYYWFSYEVLFNCKNLTKIEMISLHIEVLYLDKFPTSLEEMVIRDLELERIDDNLSNLNKLKILDLQNNQITFSMLEDQILPSSLVYINLSNNKIENLSCLHLDNCVHMKDLILEKVTANDEPEGASQLLQLLSIPNSDIKINAVLTNYHSKVIFKIVNGVEEESILTSIYKKRKIC